MARYFSTCLLERLLLWGDAQGPAGGKWHAWAGRQALSSHPLISSAASSMIQSCAKGMGDGRWWGGRQHQQPWAGAMTQFHSALILWGMRAGCRYKHIRQPHGCIRAVSRLQPYSRTSFPSSFEKCPRPSALLAFCHYALLYSLPSCWLGSRHKESLEDKTTRCCCRGIIIKDPQFSHPLNIGPPFICGRLLIHVTSQWGIPFPDNIIPSPVQTGYLLYSCLSPGESDTQTS